MISQVGARLVIAGAGLIGLEVAATAAVSAPRVTVVDPFAIPLERARRAASSVRVCESMHRGHGVDMRLATAIERVETGAAADRA